MKKSDFKLKTTYQVDVSDEYDINPDDLLDGYGASNQTQTKDISWDNAHKAVDELIKANILHFKKKRTIERKVVKNVLYSWIEEYFDLTDIYECNCFILNNQDLFADLIQKTAQKYKEHKGKENKKEKPQSNPFELKNRKFIGNVEKVKFNKYAYEQCYLNKDRSNLEKSFESYIDGRDDVNWWYKNGDYGSKHFGRSYWDSDEDKYKIFYPDYMVRFNDGTMGIYDTKSGFTLKLAKPKADALNVYLSNKPNLKGGIVCKVGSVWKISKDPFSTDISKWDNF